MKLVFWVCVSCVAFTYLGYPMVLWLLSWPARRRDNTPQEMTPLPKVSVIIAAYNEERVIGEKIENTLALNYPRDKMEIIVVSDGSDDATPDIVERYVAEGGIISLHQPDRRGKSAALNRGVAASSGVILLFSDANTFYRQDVVMKLVRHFSDPAVGGACGRKAIVPDQRRESSLGDGLYWEYESYLKGLESRMGSITAADGEIFALRRQLFRPIDPAVINDDAELTIGIVAAGYRIVYEPEAVAEERASISLLDDYHVKARMVAGGFQTVARHWRFLLFTPRPFGVQFFSHKILRWLAPLLLLGAFVSSALMSRDPVYAGMLLFQSVFYCMAIIGYIRILAGRDAGMSYVPLYITTMNVAALAGLIRFLRRRQTPAWRKASR